MCKGASKYGARDHGLSSLCPIGSVETSRRCFPSDLIGMVGLVSPDSHLI